MDIKYNMPYVKKSQMYIVYTKIHNYKVFQKTTVCYIFKDNKYNITMCPIKKRCSSSHYHYLSEFRTVVHYCVVIKQETLPVA